MTRPVFATCDHCNEIFTVKYKETQHPKGIKETYFTCIHCGKRYTSFVTDDKVRQMHKKIIRMRRGNAKTQELMKLQTEINYRMTKLKQELINNG